MAVTQISKIQVRRGKKSQNGVPQLSSGEFAWVVDAQELYIGNGSVAEGAPFVGNTQILTEHTNILDFAGSYQFGTYSDDSPITDSVPRSLGGKIDEIQVSVKDFGAVGDGETNDTPAFELAFSNLFETAFETYRKVLTVPNGVYVLSNLEVPSNVILRGETQEESVLDISNWTIDLSGKQNIQIENITIQKTNGEINIDGLANSRFVDISVKGEYSLHQGTTNDATFVSIGTAMDDIEFHNCEFNGLGIVFQIQQQIGSQSNMTFKHCRFFNVFRGVDMVGLPNIKNRYRVLDTQFDEIFSNAVLTSGMTNCLIRDCEFNNCSNGNSTSPIVPIVDFGNESFGNLVVECSCDRQQLAENTDSDQYITEVKHSAKTVLIDQNQVEIAPSNSRIPVFSLSGENHWYIIHYSLKLSDVSRQGELLVSPNFDQNYVALTDHYQYSTETSSTPLGKVLTDFEFSAEFRRTAPSSSQREADTIVIKYINPFSTQGDSVIPNVGSLSFDVTYGV